MNHLCNNDKETAPTSKFSALLASSPGWGLITTFLKKECRRVQQVHHFGMEERILTLSEIKYLWRLVQIWKVVKQVEYRCRVGSAQYNSMTFQEKEKEKETNNNNNNNAHTDDAEQTSNLIDHPVPAPDPNATITTTADGADYGSVAITNDINLLSLSLHDENDQEQAGKDQRNNNPSSLTKQQQQPREYEYEYYIEKIFSVDEVLHLILFV